MHYPSILILPLPMAVFSALHRIYGPKKTIQITDQWAHKILTTRKTRRIGIEPEDLGFELRLLNKLMPKPYLACFEQACAFQLWLACHGQKAQVCIGKRMENDELLMHAWLETEPEPFFYDARFQEITWDKRNT